MTKTLDWKTDTSLPAGKGATVHRFTATGRAVALEIQTAPWGEGETRAPLAGETSERRCFRDLDWLAVAIANRSD